MVLAADLMAVFGAGWPDLLVAIALLVVFLRSALRVLRIAMAELRASRIATG